MRRSLIPCALVLILAARAGYAGEADDARQELEQARAALKAAQQQLDKALEQKKELDAAVEKYQGAIQDLTKKVDEAAERERAVAIQLQPAAGAETMYVSKVRGLTIPVEVAPTAGQEVVALVLLVSQDRGKTWEKVGLIRVRPGDGEVGPFEYAAPNDGVYWFAVQAAYRRDRGAVRVDPADRKQIKPALKVLVETAADDGVRSAGWNVPAH